MSARKLRRWIVPVLAMGREIDGIYVDARSAKAARSAVLPTWDERGYCESSGYSLGEPVPMPDRVEGAR